MYIYIYNLSTFSYQLADRNSSSYWRKKERKGTIFIEDNYAPHRHRRFIRLDVSSDSLLPNLHPRTFFDYLKGQKRSIEASPPPSLPPLYRVTCTVHAPRARARIRACVCVCIGHDSKLFHGSVRQSVKWFIHRLVKFGTGQILARVP